MPEMTETQTTGRKPKKKKNKESHNAVERHRKEKINAGINRIGNLLPCSQALKQSKNMILDQAFRYITELKKQNDTMLLEGGDKVQAEEIRQLRGQLEELRKESAHYIELLKAHDITLLEDPTIHWKGKQRSAKVAKVTPTHQLSKGIIVYSNGNVTCPAGKEASPGKQPAETLILQSESEVSGRLRVNGALLQVNTSSSTPALLPGSAVTPTQSTPGLRVVEQCVVETPAAAPALPPSVSYITLQIPTASTALPQQQQPAAPAPALTLTATSASQLVTESPALPVSTLTTFSQAVTRAATSDVGSVVTQDTTIRTVSYTAIPNSQALLRAGAAGSTQTTWTTLQMAGNTVQPVCQSLPTPEVSNTIQAVQQVTLCPVTNKPSVQPIQIQMQPNVPVQQAPITAHIQAQPFQRPPQLRPTILNQTQPQPVLAPQPQCAVLPQSAIVPQPTVVAHPAVVSQPQPAVLQPASLLPNPPTALIPQPQPALVPQQQATVLPLLQTMQVLQVNPTGATASGVTAPQNTNNPSVVILQQASSCPAQSVVREEIANQTPCQHIVIIQAPNQAAAAPQNPPVGMLSAAVPSAVPAVSTQISTTSSSTCATSLQSVGGKQLVHILPRPVQPPLNHPLHVTQASSTPAVPPTPQTITVNGQVFALQPMKASDKASSQGGQSTLQLVQPTTTEEPTTNVALNSLGALSSLNQSISQGLPLAISSQNNGQPPAAALSVVPQQQQQPPPVPAPVSGATLTLPVRQLQVPCLSPVTSGLVVNASKPSGKRLRTSLNIKRATAKRTKPVKKKVLSQVQPALAVSAKPVVAAGESPTVQVTASPVLQSSTVKITDLPPTCTTAVPITDSTGAAGNVASTQNTKKIIVCSSSAETTILSHSHAKSKSSVSAPQSDATSSHTTTSGVAATVTTINATSGKPQISAAVVTESKTASASTSNSTVSKVSVPEVKQPATSTATSTTQSKPAASIAVSRQSRSVVSCTSAAETGYTSTTVCTACLTPVCTGSITTTVSMSLSQASQPTSVCQGSHTQAPLPCSKPQTHPTASSSVSTAVALSSPAPTFSAPHSSVTATSSDYRKRVSTSRAPTQQPDMSMPNPSPCHPIEVVKPPQAPRRDREHQEERHPIAPEKDALVVATPDAPSRKDFGLPQQVYTNLDDQTLEHPMTSSRQTDSPMSTGAGGGRGFSVASMLPQGHNISASSGSFGTFTFTSEQAEMLALAMLEQDSPGRRSGGCSGDSTSANPSTATWEPPKTPPVSTIKERGSAGQQTKAQTKPMDTVTVKPAVQVSVRGQVGEGAVNGPNGSRHPQNVSYSQSQPLPQVQSQSSSQSGTVASLSVNNLIRPSSSQQPYPGSPSLAGQQGSVPSPVGPSVHISQPSNNALSPCSGAPLPSEYTPLKTALMRAQAGVGVAERQVKIISKRQAQEAVMLNTGKRPKPCPPSATTVSHMDVKAPDHSQMMVGQLLPTSSAVMTRINSESGGPLFSTNTFMSPVVRPTDGHCPPQGPTEQNQPGVLHLPQGHPQHAATQPGQHLGGNIYMKQQQQEQQRHHLYHLQHHLTQPDPAQRHSLHQRALQQQQQQQQQQEQQQHVQKKQGLVRGNQTGSPAGLQQKQHHLEKSGVQQHSHQQQTQHQQHTQQQQQQQSQQHPQQSHQQSQPHQQPTQHQQSHPQQHQQQTHQQQPQTQHQQHQQQQQQQQLQQQQSSHSRHQQHLQQQIQQQQHFRHQEKSCEAQAAGSRAHHSNHLAQQEHLKPGQDHNAMQRMMSSRTLEQQLISPPSNPVSRSSDLACTPSRQERHRVSNYSAEALIGKSSTSGEQQQRMGLHLQPGHGAAQEQPDHRGYLDTSRAKANIAHNPQARLPSDHPGSTDVQRVSECPPFKAMVGGGGGGAHQLGGFEAQVSRGSDMATKSVPPSQRGPQGQQQQGGFRMNVGPPADGRNRGGYSATHPGSQGVQVGPALSREQDGCHQSFMQSLLSPHLPEQSNHQRAVQCCPPVSMEYSCVPGSSSADIQAKASSPSVPQTQKAPAMRLREGNKGHISQVSSNMHGGPGVRAGLPHPPTPHSSSEPGRSSAPSRTLTAVSQHSRHITRDAQPAKLRPGDRPRSGTLRPSNPFEPEGHLPLPSGGGVLLGRPQSGGEARRSTIVRFMADSAQVPSENNLVADQHITQNFGFPFIPEGGMNPPINANSTFIPPVSQPNASRTPSLLPVEPQNTLPSFYPSYSPAAHPSLPSDVTLQYFPNQMFTSPSADKGSAPPLNNRFGSILSPPRPVGFGQASFPLLPDMPPMPIANSSGITPHISNFSLTSLFPEIATGMPTDGSTMPMSPLLSLSNTSSADSSKQPNRPAHNISHILGHDGSSAV